MSDLLDWLDLFDLKQKRLVHSEDEAFPSTSSGRRLRGTTSIQLSFDQAQDELLSMTGIHQSAL
jgi:hypothetical protein